MRRIVLLACAAGALFWGPIAVEAAAPQHAKQARAAPHSKEHRRWRDYDWQRHHRAYHYPESQSGPERPLNPCRPGKKGPRPCW
ncbi:MAG: hypothetical protein QOH04_856 [Sphingomonadales bacterium]|jgi:hypothetical protein|nr:hypothetical protein [Sphingomonadales bacterium]MEA3035097.1 hypothetical protein [Sphingomonadales bacterium]